MLKKDGWMVEEEEMRFFLPLEGLGWCSSGRKTGMGSSEGGGGSRKVERCIMSVGTVKEKYGSERVGIA